MTRSKTAVRPSRRSDPLEDLPEFSPAPLYNHPLVGISIVLMVAVAGQFAVRQLAGKMIMEESSTRILMAHPAITDLLTALSTQVAALSTYSSERITFSLYLCLSLLSLIGWYIAARTLLGPGWGLSTALLWSLHPLFAFTAQRAIPLQAVIFLFAMVFACLTGWATRGNRWLAILTGLLLGPLAVASPICLVAVGLILPVCVATVPGIRRRWQGTLLLLGSLAISGYICVQIVPGEPGSLLEQYNQDLWTALDTADGTAMSQAARMVNGTRSGTFPPAAVFLVERFSTAPGESFSWWGRRMLKTGYHSSNPLLETIYFVIQICGLLLTIWAIPALVLSGGRRRRGLMILLLVASFWGAVAVVDPRMMNLAPVGGGLVLLPLIGLNDLMRRIFGRHAAAGIHESPD